MNFFYMTVRHWSRLFSGNKHLAVREHIYRNKAVMQGLDKKGTFRLQMPHQRNEEKHPMECTVLERKSGVQTGYCMGPRNASNAGKFAEVPRGA